MKKRRYFVLFELLLALFLASFFMTSIALCWRAVSFNRRLEHQMARAIACCRLKRYLSEHLDAIVVPRREKRDPPFFCTERANELFFTYQPAFGEIEHLGPIARGNLKIDSLNNLQLISQNISLSHNLGDEKKEQLLLQGVEQLAFDFIPTKKCDEDFGQSQSQWSNKHFLPHMMKVVVTFLDGEIWEMPHIFQASNFQDKS